VGPIIDQIVNGLATGVVYGLVAAGLSVLFKVLDTVNFAHGDFYVLGGVVAYVGATIVPLNPFLTLALAAIVVGGLGALLHLPLRRLLRTNPFNVLLATFAVSLGISNLVSFGFGGRAQPVPAIVEGALTLGPVVITYQRLIAAAVGLLAIWVVALWLKTSKTGRSVRAVADNRAGAQILGIDTVRIDRLVFIISGACAGLAGAALAPVTQASPFGGLPVMVTAFVVLVIGGVGSVPGALLGGVLLGVIEGLTAAILGAQWTSLVGYVLLIAALFLRPALERARGNDRRILA
jgi:branched-chain amino acid transport system permease protein